MWEGIDPPRQSIKSKETQMRNEEYADNPLVRYLIQEGVTPGDFAVLANVDHNKVYEVMHGRVRALPQSFIDALDERSGTGAGARMRETYRFYREDLRGRLQEGLVAMGSVSVLTGGRSS
jgi:hypothetical protein